MTPNQTQTPKYSVAIIVILFVSFSVYRAVQAVRAADRARACCTITHEEYLELDDELQKALRIQDEFNRQYTGGFLGAATRICKDHGWDCPGKVVFDPRTFSQGGPTALTAGFHEIPPPPPNSPNAKPIAPAKTK